MKLSVIIRGHHNLDVLKWQPQSFSQMLLGIFQFYTTDCTRFHDIILAFLVPICASGKCVIPKCKEMNREYTPYAMQKFHKFNRLFRNHHPVFIIIYKRCKWFSMQTLSNSAISISRISWDRFKYSLSSAAVIANSSSREISFLIRSINNLPPEIDALSPELPTAQIHTDPEYYIHTNSPDSLTHPKNFIQAHLHAHTHITI